MFYERIKKKDEIFMLLVTRMVQFPSPQVYDKALRAVRSRPLRLDRVMVPYYIGYDIVVVLAMVLHKFI